MNTDNLHTLIERYEENYYVVNNQEHDEKFKWEATQCFRKVWFEDPEAQHMAFSERFQQAMKKSSVLINNSMVSPTNGIVKMAEARPQEIESLFRDVLFAPYNSVKEVQEHMDLFLEETEKIRQDLFPQYYRYKQERHAASCYLSFYDPEHHYIYRYSEAEDFAKYIEFGKDLGSGADFHLEHYYEMADMVVEALREHPTLLEKYEKLLKDDPNYYYDESLHLMAFDLMYCCRYYNFYHGLRHATKKDSIRAYTQRQLKEKEEAECQERIHSLEDQIQALDVRISEYRALSLLGVEVQQKQYGKGVVIGQKDENITVRFHEKQVNYIISSKFPMRPRFIDDEAIVTAYTELADMKKQQEALQNELKLM